ncbi:activating signal cointegrator 1 isoform X2 [Syngnathoides biaculeatus]|uniref:activating signal cointegrator 1 isoform X2 n=1 Tax=Syngnathoides biaculeatus TaxID=300417 RepID=UPI002ADE81DB|nr:activating signal cointegrator 1 isoform X2 [Syngnathoides biaculeatus]
MEMADDLLQWCLFQLQHRFGLEASEDIVKYIISIEKAEEIEEYVGDLLQGTDGTKGQFIEEFLSRWKKTHRQAGDTAGLFILKESVLATDSTKDSQKKSKRKGRHKQELLTVSQTDVDPETVKTPIELMRVQGSASASSTKKKNKFTNLYAKEGQDKLMVLLPGRHSCECLAQKHRLINNCISCGRIVCEQEGSGPCLFCGTLVCTKEEQEILLRDSNKSQKLRKKLMGDGGERDYLTHHEAKMKAGLEKAVQHKDKLLEYDRTSVKRTQVLDDESDYFGTESNQWLSTAERDKLRKKEEELRNLRHACRKDRKITLDFAGRQVLDEGNNLNEYYNKLEETLQAMSIDSAAKSPLYKGQSGQQNLRQLVNPNIKQSAPEWVDVGPSENSKRNMEKGPCVAQDSKTGERAKLRLQDKELQEMSDGGWCLSMHQPWASLLVKGIKRVEGRTWYTSHRGRLWIAAAAKKPTPQEIAEVEAMYSSIYKKETRFPSDYPTGCLLGCVNVTDCLSQEQFREQFPNICEESSSPFVFICSNSQELLVKFPMKGKHKISGPLFSLNSQCSWLSEVKASLLIQHTEAEGKLESHYHQGAKKGLVASATE